ncbi:hypothetical protein [Parafrankia soli]|uniref:hypothetical protein n=1 Tax=Parafrankia soli TaxID=2599596 RepID=UPI0012FF8927|nr:hypothetical protein [Parafrankia soli]
MRTTHPGAPAVPPPVGSGARARRAGAVLPRVGRARPTAVEATRHGRGAAGGLA